MKYTARKKGGRTSKAPKDDDKLLSEYEVMPAKELASRYGVSEPTMRRWISDARIRLGVK